MVVLFTLENHAPVAKFEASRIGLSVSASVDSVSSHVSCIKLELVLNRAPNNALIVRSCSVAMIFDGHRMKAATPKLDVYSSTAVYLSSFL